MVGVIQKSVKQNLHSLAGFSVKHRRGQSKWKGRRARNEKLTVDIPGQQHIVGNAFERTLPAKDICPSSNLWNTQQRKMLGNVPQPKTWLMNQKEAPVTTRHLLMNQKEAPVTTRHLCGAVSHVSVAQGTQKARDPHLLQARDLLRSRNTITLCLL